MKVAYIGAFGNLSGYADAARNNVCALSSVGFPVDAIPLSFENFQTDCGELGKKIKPLITSNSNAPIQIIHTIPTVFPKFISISKYNIGYTAWETSKLPPQFLDCINQLNEVWVPSEYNKEVFINSGVDIPVYTMSHTFNIDTFDKEITRESLTKPAGFTFYSVFQWIARKGPEDLLKAYLTEFSANENVCLLLKTYLFDPTNPMDKERIKEQISNVKESLRLPSYPNLSLISAPLSRPQINALHKSCDCLISPHKGEGFGITMAEAMIAANPVIATNYSGNTDFLTEDNGYPTDYQLSPVCNMPWEWYDASQNWADVDIIDLKKKMRYVFENQQEANVKGIKAKRFIEDNLSWQVIGNKMKNRLEEIYAAL